MRHPFDNFIKARILLGDSDEHLSAACETHRLFIAPSVKDTYFSQLRAEVASVSKTMARYLAALSSPNVEGVDTVPVRKPSVTIFQKALLDCRLVYTPDDPIVQEAMAIVFRQRVRRCIEVMALREFPLEEIIDAMDRSFGIEFNEDILECYLFYFFDVFGVDSIALRYALYLREIQVLELQPHSEVLGNDPSVVLARLGVSVQFDVRKNLEMMIDQGAAAYKRLMMMPGSETSLPAMSWARTVAGLAQAYNGAGGTEDDWNAIREEFEAIHVEVEEAKFKTLEELHEETGGQVSDVKQISSGGGGTLPDGAIKEGAEDVGPDTPP